jgi:hypothetical protein
MARRLAPLGVGLLPVVVIAAWSGRRLVQFFAPFLALPLCRGGG